jgi:hypothetical protein
MLLAEANHKKQPCHPSWVPFAKANHQSHPGHQSQMPLAEANHQSTFHNRFNIHQQLIQHFIISLTFINNSIDIS